jgi:hypothetical protein
MTSFTLTPVEKGIMRCRHTGELSHEEVQTLAAFLYDYRGKLLVDLTDTTAEECARNLRNFAPMMPTTAIFGADLDPEVLAFPESYYTHEVKLFDTEAEALAWLREQ